MDLQITKTNSAQDNKIINEQDHFIRVVQTIHVYTNLLENLINYSKNLPCCENDQKPQYEVINL